MLTLPLTSSALVAVRARAREIAALVGMDSLHQTRFSTAVSELTRHAVQQGVGGQVSFSLAAANAASAGQALVAVVSSSGVGSQPVEAAAGMQAADGSQQAIGIAGAARLVDRLRVESAGAAGTRVVIEMDRPRGARPIGPAELAALAQRLAGTAPASAQDELEQQNRELFRIHEVLREKQAELERADERKNEFVTMLAHELRGPLGTLDLVQALMRADPQAGPAELARRLDVMSRQTAHLSKLVDDLMDVSRVSQGKVELRLQRIDLSEAVIESVEACSGGIMAKSHDLALDTPGEPLWAQVDPVRIRQVVTNLIQNSVRYTPDHGKIAVRASRDGSHAAIEVRDNGIGIDAEMLPHVFGLFVQGHARGARSDGGLGVGLALVRALVGDHGGEVSAASEGLGRGSVFTVRLPLDAPA